MWQARVIVTLVVILSCHSAGAAENPYENLPFQLEVQQVEDLPVYYTIGYAGVPNSVNAGHTSNAGFVITQEGVVVFDALGTPALGWALLQSIRQRTDQPVKYVVISHYHADHIYGLQAFKEHTGATVIAQENTSQYFNPETLEASEQAQRRLEQRRQALFPWVNKNTYLVSPDQLFDKRHTFELGDTTFTLVHMGPAHAPGDSIMIVPTYRVVFSGDVIYTGRIPFLDSPHVDSSNWLEGLDYLQNLKMDIRRIIPGHGKTYKDVNEAIRFTGNYIKYLRDEMGDAAQNFVPFEEAYEQTDWSQYETMPAFDASNRGNAYRIYLEMEEEQFAE